MTEAQLISLTVRERAAAGEARDRHLAEAGRACAQLHSLGWTWEQVAAALATAGLAVDPSTAWRWARPHLPARRVG